MIIRDDRTVGQLVAERPALSRVFEQFGIDYCCGGKQTIAAACEQRGLDVAAVAGAVSAALEGSRQPGEGPDWRQASITELCDHIVERHHGFLREELPRLSQLVEKVEKAHGARHPELHEVREVFDMLTDDLVEHTLVEERVLFPACQLIERGEPTGLGAIGVMVAAMEHDHEVAGDGLARLRRLTGGYVPPDAACNSYRAMLEGLGSLERDMHEHVHLENAVLFPKALAMESAQG